VALLLLRAVFGGALIAEATCYLRQPAQTPIGALLGLISAAAGALLLVGFVTPIAGIIVGLEGVGAVTSLLPFCATPQFSSGNSPIFAATILITIIILGPGAFSLDARLFGRREIIIPRRSTSL
jgi:uncharacterized membrane protein YphA (DoxX/SURF4 family)